MPRPRSIPRPYTKSGQWVVCLPDAQTKTRRTVYLGAPDSPEARLEYARVLAEWEAADRTVAPAKPRPRKRVHRAGDVTVNAVVLSYFKGVVKPRHSRGDKLTVHGQSIREALRFLRQHAGDTPACDFGPKLLREVRAKMAATGRFCRPNVNKNVRHVVNAFKHTVSEELVPASVYEALTTLEPLRAGEVGGLREYRDIKPVADSVVDATLPHLPLPVRGVVELMRLTGARCGELLNLRPVDLDTTGQVWRAELKAHKTAHKGKTRTLWFGPAAQEVLRPFLSRAATKPLFSPQESMAASRAARRQARVTPESCGNRPGTNRVESPRWKPGTQYTTNAVGLAVTRACKAAFPAPDGLSESQRKAWEKEHRWTVHQLRHAAATRIRKAAGLEAAAVVLGHSSATLTDATYALRDEKTAVDVLSKIG
ncbi:MAG: site-specific integrase [Planctomycetota bacterium]